MTRPVLHVVAAGEIGGAERMLVDLAGARAGERPHVIALFTPNDGLRALFRDAGLDVEDRGPVEEGPLSFVASSLGARDVGWLADVIARRDASIVHLHTFASQVLGTRAARRAGARVVRTEHSTRVYEDPSCWPFARWSLPRADVVVFISEHVRNVAQAKAPFVRRGIVVHNGVDTDRFRPAPILVEEETRDVVRFVAVGRLDRRKGLDIALEALAAVPAAELEIVGEGEEQAALAALAQRHGVADRVVFAGYRADVREAIARADVALSSARAEGLGIALLEAMAMGRPVVALPVGGIVEIVRPGDDGWLADGHDARALATVMREAGHDANERRRRGALARERVVRSFSLARMREGYGALYSSLAP